MPEFDTMVAVKSREDAPGHDAAIAQLTARLEAAGFEIDQDMDQFADEVGATKRG
jgi:hypothetical protein